MRSQEYYAAIDLGSNSFHMLVVREVAGDIQVVSKIKRKVRLAAGLNDQFELSAAAWDRALACLTIFADRVQDIAPENIRAVGTATLRKIVPQADFLTAAEATLGHPIRIISGQEEAATIYQGIAHTSAFHGRMLVIDIGGASTELALGEGFTPQELRSLDMGCVTWLRQYFPHGRITAERCAAAQRGARELVEPHAAAYLQHGWEAVLGASGTFKGLQEMARARRMPLRFSHAWLQELLAEAIACGHIDDLDLYGLRADRRQVFISGLCILLGIMQCLPVRHIEAAEGALREGLVYGMLEQLQHEDVQLRTLESLVQSYQLDQAQALRVAQQCYSLLQQLPVGWLGSSPEEQHRLVRAASYLHEIGLTLSYKHASSHSQYLLEHSNLPGFNVREREQLVAMLAGIAGIIDEDTVPDVLPDTQALSRLTRVLRLALVLCQRRRTDAIPVCQLQVQGEHLTLNLPVGFARTQPFLHSLLQHETELQQEFGGLSLVCDLAH